MNEEFRIAVFYKYAQSISTFNSIQKPYVTTTSSFPKVSRQPEKEPLGIALTQQGPAPYAGDILNSPNMVWTDDQWSPEREQEAVERIAKQGENISSYWLTTYTKKADSFWHKFYKRNQDHFYKDRHYLHIVFPELLGSTVNTNVQTDIPEHQLTQQPVPSSTVSVSECLKPAIHCADSKPLHLLEVGCGVGNAVLPLLDLNPNLHVTAIDFAASAVDILNKHPAIQSGRLCTAIKCVVRDDLPVKDETVDLALCMFVLSAINPTQQQVALRKIVKALRVGGKLLFRDYGRFDEAQLRFRKGSKLDDNFYVRQDGTCSYFFSPERLRELCTEAGLVEEENEYIYRQFANRQQKKARYRVWIHGKFIKP